MSEIFFMLQEACAIGVNGAFTDASTCDLASVRQSELHAKGASHDHTAIAGLAAFRRHPENAGAGVGLLVSLTLSHLSQRCRTERGQRLFRKGRSIQITQVLGGDVIVCTAGNRQSCA